MDIAIAMRKEHGIVTNMHLTCTNIEAEKVTAALEQAKESGIRNIVALRGDAPEGQATWETTAGGFACAADLVAYIRKQFGDAFCISVAGYPEGHPEKIKEVAGGRAALSVSEQTRYSAQTNEDGSESVFVCSDADYAQELLYLKAKVDAGADFIITQMFFDVEVRALVGTLGRLALPC
jgi:methylenetetrahydrofolate reductase (NADPH)